jgi:2-dehydro-3-deoxygalactonokinase
MGFLSCDWGTSSLRLRLVSAGAVPGKGVADAAGLRVVAEEKTGQGIAAVFALWRQTGKEDQAERLSFYLGMLDAQIQKIAQRLGHSLDGFPVIVSGMASSSIGMLPLDYQDLPFPIDGSQAKANWIGARPDFAHDMLLISGLRGPGDVMRGEETQLTGCIPDALEMTGDHLFIFPGTHSKHILVRARQVRSFTTYMTGEFFELLSQKSILGSAVEKNPDLGDAGNLSCFRQGVADAREANLLHAAFGVRVNELFGPRTKQQNHHYLSGLLIGTELRAIPDSGTTTVYLCCGADLKPWYETALAQGEGNARIHVFPAEWADGAVVRGQFAILNHYKR